MMFQIFEKNGAHELRIFNKTVGSFIVIDTGLLIEFLSASQHGKKIDAMIFKNEYIASVLISPDLNFENIN